MPFFSIIIPMFNRGRLIDRAVQSCLSQSYGDFEIIVVDDASTDASVAAVERIHDKRITLIRQETNRGVGPARNRGIAAASGEWILCLDSDDEIAPDGLETIRRHCIDTPRDVHALRFMCRLDDGTISPGSYFSDAIWDYETYFRWMERAAFQPKGQETFLCARRETFVEVRYPDDRSLELKYHIDFSARFRTRTVPEVIRLYHQDAANALTRSSSMALLRKTAPAELSSIENVLSSHRDAFRKWAPMFYAHLLKGCATLCFLMGKRARGVRYAAQSMRAGGHPIESAAVVLLGSLGPRPLYWGKVMRMRFR